MASTYEQIRQGILNGTLPPGSALVETTIANWCGVSRTPVREAFTRLEQDGLLARTDRGLVVKERTPEEILDIYEVRVTLEGLSAGMAAERRTQLDIARIKRAHDLGMAADTNNGELLAEHNREFHHAIAAASHNESLIDLLGRLDMHLLRYPATTLTYPGRWKQAIDEHEEMADAIQERNSARASQIATKHFARARDIRLELWRTSLAE